MYLPFLYKQQDCIKFGYVKKHISQIKSENAMKTYILVGKHVLLLQLWLLGTTALQPCPNEMYGLRLITPLHMPLCT